MAKVAESAGGEGPDATAAATADGGGGRQRQTAANAVAAEKVVVKAVVNAASSMSLPACVLGACEHRSHEVGRHSTT